MHVTVQLGPDRCRQRATGGPIAIELVRIDQVWRKSHQAASFSSHRDLIVNSQAYRLYSIHATSVADAVKRSSESLRVVVPIFVSVRGD